MDLIGIIKPKSVNIENDKWIRDEAVDGLLRLELLNLRAFLASYSLEVTNNNSVTNYVVHLEEYLEKLYGILGGRESGGELEKASRMVMVEGPVVWQLPITPDKASLSVRWTVYNEIQMSIIALSLGYFRLGSNVLNSDFFMADLDLVDLASLEVKWKAISNNFFKKSAAIIEYLRQNMVAATEEVLETSGRFVNFVASYVHANFQLVVLVKNFWSERLENTRGVLYNLEDLNSEFYKKNNYHLLIKIATYVLNELKGLDSYLSEFEQNLGSSYKFISSSDFKSIIKRFSEADSQDEDEEEEQAGVSFSTKRALSGIVKKLKAMRKLVQIFTIYVKVYLIKYLCLDNYILKNRVGYAISLIDYGFELVNNGLAVKKTDKEKLKNIFKKKYSDKKTSKGKDKFVTQEQLGDGDAELLATISNAGVYRKYLEINLSNRLVLLDLGYLLANLKNLNYKLSVQNDNLSFEKITKVTNEELHNQLPLGKKLPISLGKWSPIKHLAKETDGYY